VAGFVVMLACCMWAVTSYRHMSGVTSKRAPLKERREGKPGKQPGTSVMERLEERWRRRQEGDR
jgi:hypothetical protein